MEDFFDVDISTRFFRDENGSLRAISSARRSDKNSVGHGAQSIPGGAASGSTFAFNPMSDRKKAARLARIAEATELRGSGRRKRGFPRLR